MLKPFEAESVTFRENIVYPIGNATTGIEGMCFDFDEFRIIDPKLVKSKGMYRLSDATPSTVNAALGTFTCVDKDIEN